MHVYAQHARTHPLTHQYTFTSICSPLQAREHPSPLSATRVTEFFGLREKFAINYSSSLCATKGFESSKNLIFHEPYRKNTPKFQFAVQIGIFQKTLFFDLPSPIVSSVTQRTHVQICYCCQKVRLIDFSSLQKF